MTTTIKNSQAGLTFIEFLVVVMVLAVLAMMLLPAIAKKNSRSSRLGCVNNLKQISLSFKQWSLDSSDKYPMQVSVTNGGTMEWVGSGLVYPHFLAMSNELNTPKVLFCPQEENQRRSQASAFTTDMTSASSQGVFSTNNVSYFIGVDAVDSQSKDLLIGDDNFTVNGKRPVSGLLSLWTNSPVAWTKQRHINQGNIGLADGSVFSVSSAKLREHLVQTGSATNRLAMP